MRISRRLRRHERAHSDPADDAGRPQSRPRLFHCVGRQHSERHWRIFAGHPPHLGRYGRRALRSRLLTGSCLEVPPFEPWHLMRPIPGSKASPSSRVTRLRSSRRWHSTPKLAIVPRHASRNGLNDSANSTKAKRPSGRLGGLFVWGSPLRFAVNRVKMRLLRGGQRTQVGENGW